MVEVHCYAEVTRPDAVTARLQEYADHWLATVGLSDDDLAERIRTRRHRYPGRSGGPHRGQPAPGICSQAGAGAGDVVPTPPALMR